MTLLKTGLLNAIAVSVRVLTALALNKVLAVQIGPAGYAIVGQFQNFVTMVTTIASGGVTTGVTKYTAEYADDEPRQIALWQTAGTVALAGSVVFAAIIVLLYRQLGSWVLDDESLAGVFVWFGAALTMYVANAFLVAILNGKKDINRYVAVNIGSSVVSLLFTAGLAIGWGLYGALVALAINQSIVFCVTIALCQRVAWLRLRNLAGGIDPAALRNLAKFVLMALISAACVPVSQILIRNHLGTTFGWDAAGQWEALMRISNLYLLIVTTPLGVYYLPRLSEIRNNAELKREITGGYKLLLPVTVAGAIVIYMLRDWLVVTLFTAQFAPMRDLFAWQLAGDTVKIGSWLLGYVLLGKAMTRAFILTEIVFSVSWVIWVLVLTAWFGERGAQMAYFANYLLYWLTLFAIVIQKLRAQ